MNSNSNKTWQSFKQSHRAKEKNYIAVNQFWKANMNWQFQKISLGLLTYFLLNISLYVVLIIVAKSTLNYSVEPYYVCNVSRYFKVILCQGANYLKSVKNFIQQEETPANENVHMKTKINSFPII